MGRAIVREPAAFLMDEPLSNLDAKLRVQMRAEIAQLQHDLETTTIYVTHDQVEAMTMGDRVAVMRKGELQQVAAPQELYDQPVNLFVGGFIGSPAMNLLEAKLEQRNGDLVAIAGSQEIVADGRDDERAARAAEVRGPRRDPRHPARGPRGRSARRRRPRRPAAARRGDADRGARRRDHGRTSASTRPRQRPRTFGSSPATPATEGLAERNSEHGATMVGRFGARSRVRLNEKLEVAVDTRALHFFDPQTGLGIYDETKGSGT